MNELLLFQRYSFILWMSVLLAEEIYRPLPEITGNVYCIMLYWYTLHLVRIITPNMVY